MPEYDRQRIGKLTFNDLEVGVAKAARADANKDIRRLQVAGRDLLDHQRLTDTMQHGGAEFHRSSFILDAPQIQRATDDRSSARWSDSSDRTATSRIRCARYSPVTLNYAILATK